MNNEDNLNQQQIIQYVIVLSFKLTNTVEFLFKERIASVIARIINYLRNNFVNYI